jgi:FixJ family two-component response regulator
MPAPLIAVVDDDGALRQALVRLFASAGYAALSYASAEAFLAERGAACCMVLDRNLPGMSGPELLRRLRAAGDFVPVIMMTGRDVDELEVARALQSGAAAWLCKPFAGEELLDVVRGAIRGAVRTRQPKVQ